MSDEMKPHMRPENAQWIPADFIDEISPPGKATPDAWIDKTTDGRTALICDFYETSDEGAILLEEGIHVKFTWVANLTPIHLTVNKDRTWSTSSEWPDEIPGAQLHCHVEGIDVSHLSLGDLASEIIAVYCDDELPASEVVRVYAWSRQGVEFEFRGGKFVEGVKDSGAICEGAFA